MKKHIIITLLILLFFSGCVEVEKKYVPATITGTFPEDNVDDITRKPHLSVDVVSSGTFDVHFEIDDGGWQTVDSFSNVKEGTYSVKTPKLDYATTYNWRVTVTGEEVSTVTKQFTTEPRYMKIGDAYCYGYGWVGQSIEDKDVTYMGWEWHQHDHVDRTDHYIYYREYDRGYGWGDSHIVCNQQGVDYEQAKGAYWNNKWWFCYKDDPDSKFQVISGTLDELPTMDVSEAHTFLEPGGGEGKCPGIYSFGSNKGIVITDIGHLRYWIWEDGSWGSEQSLVSGGFNPIYLQVDDSTHYIYTCYGLIGPEIQYHKSTDGGNTWSNPVDTELSDGGANQIGIARYGDTYIMIAENSNIEIRYSSDGENWGSPVVVYPGGQYYAPCIDILDEDTILWMATETSTWDGWGYGWRNQVGGTFDIPELNANSGKPTNLNMVGITLSAIAHGSETMDIAFYWDNDEFIGVDKFVKDGETASVLYDSVPLGVGGWYAVARGSTNGYWGEPRSMPDEKKSSVHGISPLLSILSISSSSIFPVVFLLGIVSFLLVKFVLKRDTKTGLIVAIVVLIVGSIVGFLL